MYIRMYLNVCTYTTKYGINVLYEVSTYVHIYVHTPHHESHLLNDYITVLPSVVYQLRTRHKVTDRYHCKALSSS